MQMTYSYWWALLWVFLAGGISLFFNFEQEETDLQGRRVLRWHWLPALLLMVPLVLLAAYGPALRGLAPGFRGSRRTGRCRSETAERTMAFLMSRPPLCPL